MLLLVVGCGGKAERTAHALVPPKELTPVIDSSSDRQGFQVSVAAPTKEHPISVGAAIFPVATRAGQNVTLAVRARIAPGWHISAVRKSGSAGRPTDTELELSPPNGIELLGDWLVPPATRQTGPLGPSDVYEGDVTFLRQLRIDADQTADKLNVECSMTYQACNDVMCMPPTPIQLHARIEVLGRGQ